MMKVVMASSSPIDTLHNFRIGKYSIITLLDMLEMMDVQATIREDEEKRMEQKRKQAEAGRNKR